MDLTPPTSQQPLPGDPPQQSALKILSILWYIYAGLMLLGLFIGGLYLAIGITAFSDDSAFTQSIDLHAPPPEFFAWLFTSMGAGIIIFAIVIGVLSLFTARGLSKRHRFMTCVITSAIICINIPLGTALGVFTLITLFQSGIKQTFTRKPNNP